MLRFLKLEADDHEYVNEDDEGLYFKANGLWRYSSEKKVRDLMLHEALEEVAKDRRLDGESVTISFEYM